MNPRQLRFCQNYAAGATLTQAYIDAGYKARGAGANSARLIENDSIRAQVDEYKAKLTLTSDITRDDLVRMQRDVYNMAIEQGNSSAASKCLDSIAKLTGANAPVQTENTIKGELNVDSTTTAVTDWGALRAAKRAQDEHVAH